ncbi:hypothetical protein ZYGR_0A02900 [Zygosaccharomyces rouxii]|nr:hypothetical protein ZYGR_0A02900 [Zygosaccharomyces rouxii]
MLRDRYRETEDMDNSGYGDADADADADLPPSYDEVAGPTKSNAPYRREKASVSSNAAHTPSSPKDPLINSNRESDPRRRYSHYRGPVPSRAGGSGGNNERSVPTAPMVAAPEPRRRYDRDHTPVQPRDRYKERDYSDREHREHREHRDRERSHHHPHRHRSHRHRDHAPSSSKDKKSSNGTKPQPKNVDKIDKMDVTALFGSSFHHDGPFDAVTPHRNKNAKAPPVLAFPADGPNNSIGGAPTKKNAMNEVFGRMDPEDDDDIYQARPKSSPRTTVFGVSSDPSSANGSSTTLDAVKPGAKDLTAFDPRGRVQAVEGPTTDGLGSTTFLDGAPASNKAIGEDVRAHARQTRLGGVQRKPSLSQKLTSTVRGGSSSGPSSSYGNGSGSGTVYSRNLAPEKPLSLTRSHSGHLENGDDDEDVYLGLPSSELSRKKSTGTRLMRRVRSMKVGRK